MYNIKPGSPHQDGLQNMKIITAFVHPELAEKIAEGLASIGIVGTTATTSKDFGTNETHPVNYRGVEFDLPYKIETQLEIVAPDDRLSDAVELIKAVISHNQATDVKIFVKTMDDSIRIRDGSHGEDIL
jgi:nitrogen regulatory protein P-II 1